MINITLAKVVITAIIVYGIVSIYCIERVNPLFRLDFLPHIARFVFRVMFWVTIVSTIALLWTAQ